MNKEDYHAYIVLSGTDEDRENVVTHITSDRLPWHDFAVIPGNERVGIIIGDKEIVDSVQSIDFLQANFAFELVNAPVYLCTRQAPPAMHFKM